MITAQLQSTLVASGNPLGDFGGETLLQALVSSNYWVIGITTLVTVIVVVFMHYEGLNYLYRQLPRLDTKPRRRILLMIFVLLLMHVLEIWTFAIAYRVIFGFEDVGYLIGMSDITMFDLVYYSAVVYTTVGFGDLVPVGPLRMLTGTEALVGLVLITWSASFTFLEMQRSWKNNG